MSGDSLLDRRGCAREGRTRPAWAPWRSSWAADPRAGARGRRGRGHRGGAHPPGARPAYPEGTACGSGRAGQCRRGARARPGRIAAPGQRAPGRRSDRRTGSVQALRREGRRRRSLLRGAARSCHGFPRPERSRQVNDDAVDHGPGRARPRLGDRLRPPVPQPRLAASRSGRAPGSAVGPSRPQRLRASADAGPDQQHREEPRRRGARDRRPDLGGPPARRPVLPRHGPATGHRRGAPGRSGSPAVRRAGERPGHRRDPLGAPAAAGPGRRRAHRLCLKPPDERAGADR